MHSSVLASINVKEVGAVVYDSKQSSENCHNKKRQNVSNTFRNIQRFKVLNSALLEYHNVNSP